MPVEIRQFAFEADAEQDGHSLTGRAIVYNSRTNIGKFDEIIEPGALDNTDLKDVRLLVNHNITMIPLARSRNNTPNSTMQLIPGPDGLGFRANLDTENNMDSKALQSAVGRGDLSGMSFMMVGIEDRWENPRSEHPLRHITGIGRILEISAVTFPAYAQTAIEARGLSDALDSVPESLVKARAAEEAAERAEAERQRQIQKIRLMLEVNK